MWKYLISLGLNQLEAHPELIERLVKIISNHLNKPSTPPVLAPTTAPASKS